MKTGWAVGLLVASVLTLFAVGLLFGGENSRDQPLAVAGPGPGGASNLSLAPGLSFTDETVGAGARCASGAESF
jgi:hypothetical protein